MDYVYHEPQHEAGDRRCDLDNLLDDEHAPELTVWRVASIDGLYEAFAFTKGDALRIFDETFAGLRGVEARRPRRLPRSRYPMPRENAPGWRYRARRVASKFSQASNGA